MTRTPSNPAWPAFRSSAKVCKWKSRILATRYQDIIIDAGGRDSVELRAAMVVAHKAFVPIQASQFDIWTLGRMNDLVVTAQGFNPDLRAWVVIQPWLDQSVRNGDCRGGGNSG